MGTTRIIPFQDTDEKYIHYDLQGESLYSNPPDPNYVTVDHGHDEEYIWNWRSTTFNQISVVNDYAGQFASLFDKSHAPWWGEKLGVPTWYTKEKHDKLNLQWAIRRQFEELKIRQSEEYVPGDKLIEDRHKGEIKAFLADADRQMHEYNMKDVYVTEHKPVAKQFHTNSESEDLEFYNYEKALEQYNSRLGEQRTALGPMESGKY